ncbi:MAG: metallophosphoesterase [Polyangiaceae bacterium]
MRIAHFSDLHLMGEGPVPAHRYLNKRLTGLVNLRFRRHAVHKPDVAKRLADDTDRHGIEHVVITGDFTNLALEREFAAARRYLDAFELTPEKVSIVPGNHDMYTAGSARSKRFYKTFEPYLTSDLPSCSTDHAAGPFPYVHLRGPVALIGLASALPRPVLIASGNIGKAQLEALDRILSLPQVRSRLPVILLHHPPYNGKLVRTVTNGLYDAPELREVISRVPHAVVLHGHLHERVLRRFVTGAAILESIGATSASLVDELDHKAAGFNLYEVSDAGVWSPPSAAVLDFARDAIGGRAILETR